MRKVVLSDKDIHLFDVELNPELFLYFHTRRDVFRQMVIDQGKMYWTQYLISFRSFCVLHDIIKVIPIKEELSVIEDMYDDIFIYLHEQLVDARPNSAKNLVCDVAIVAQYQHLMPPLMQKAPVSRDPFFTKETREVFRKFFGEPGIKTSYLKILILTPILVRLGGSLCICLKRWVAAPIMSPDDKSYWTPPTPKPNKTQESHIGSILDMDAYCFICLCEATELYISEKLWGSSMGPIFMDWPQYENPKFYEPENPLFNHRADRQADWMKKLDFSAFNKFYIYVRNNYGYIDWGRGADRGHECLNCLPSPDMLTKIVNELDAWNLTARTRDAANASLDNYQVMRVQDGMKMEIIMMVKKGSLSDTGLCNLYGAHITGLFLCERFGLQTKQFDWQEGTDWTATLFEYESEKKTNTTPTKFRIRLSGVSILRQKFWMIEFINYIVKRKNRDSTGWQMDENDIAACLMVHPSRTWRGMCIRIQRGLQLETTITDQLLQLGKLTFLFGDKPRTYTVKELQANERFNHVMKERLQPQPVKTTPAFLNPAWKNVHYDADTGKDSLKNGNIPRDNKTTLTQQKNSKATTTTTPHSTKPPNERGDAKNNMSDDTKSTCTRAPHPVQMESTASKKNNQEPSKKNDTPASKKILTPTSKNASPVVSRKDDCRIQDRSTTVSKTKAANSANNEKVGQNLAKNMSRNGVSVASSGNGKVDSPSHRASSPALSDDRKKEARRCANCTRVEPVPKAFKKCQKCQATGVTDARYYCGRDCQVADWKNRHQKEHKSLKD